MSSASLSCADVEGCILVDTGGENISREWVGDDGTSSLRVMVDVPQLCCQCHCMIPDVNGVVWNDSRLGVPVKGMAMQSTWADGWAIALVFGTGEVTVAEHTGIG